MSGLKIKSKISLTKEELKTIEEKEAQIGAILGDDHTLIYTETIQRPGGIVTGYEISVVKLFQEPIVKPLSELL